jgi:N-acetylmuramoyl-L-alanine amidase
MPSVLTESVYLMFPEQESALRQPELQDRLAEAHFRAIETFVRDVAGGGRGR